MVFARSTGDDLARLVKKIDSLIADNENKKLASFVNILGKNADEAGAAAEKFAKKHDFKNVVICAAEGLTGRTGWIRYCPRSRCDCDDVRQRSSQGQSSVCQGAGRQQVGGEGNKEGPQLGSCDTRW